MLHRYFYWELNLQPTRTNNKVNVFLWPCMGWDFWNVVAAANTILTRRRYMLPKLINNAETLLVYYPITKK